MESLVEPIRNAARQLVRELHLLDNRYCIEGFTFSECHLLTELDRLGHATAKQLGDILVLEKSTMSRLVNGLLDRDCIQSSRDPEDGRQRQLSLTSRGREGVSRVHAAACEQVLGALDYLSEEEAHAAASGLNRYANGLRCLRLTADCTLRPIEPRDNPAMATIIRGVMAEFGAVGPEYSISDPEVDAMCEAYPPPRAVFYVIEKHGAVLGGGGIAPLKGGDGRVCELQKMYFLPELRGTGMGARLLKMLLSDARRLGYSQCYLETLDRMTAAQRLYARYGFDPIDSPMGCTGHGGCDAWMVKTL